MKITLVSILTGILFLFSNTSSFSQEVLIKPKHNVVAVSPLSLLAGSCNSARIRFQHAIKYRFAFGTDIKYYFPNDYPGYQVSPFVKMFTKKENAEGVYIYGTAVYGKNKGLPDDKTLYYECYGIGGGAGFQMVFGKTKCWQFDIALGLKSVTTHSNLSHHSIPEEYLVYYLVGPAAIPDGIISIGFRF
jgi:hypothetical protein